MVSLVLLVAMISCIFMKVRQYILIPAANDLYCTHIPRVHSYRDPESSRMFLTFTMQELRCLFQWCHSPQITFTSWNNNGIPIVSFTSANRLVLDSVWSNKTAAGFFLRRISIWRCALWTIMEAVQKTPSTLCEYSVPCYYLMAQRWSYHEDSFFCYIFVLSCIL